MLKGNPLMRILRYLVVSLCLPMATQATEFFVTDRDDMPLAGVVVFVADENTPNKPAKKPVAVHQTDKKFSPYITVVSQGSDVQFINDDNITHHVYAAKGPERFSFKLKRNAPAETISFMQLGDVAMGCNIHDWMGGHILVVPTGYFGITNKMGRVTIKDLPQGAVTVTVWHPQLSASNHSQQWQIENNIAANMRLQVSAKLVKVPDQEAPDDIDYDSFY